MKIRNVFVPAAIIAGTLAFALPASAKTTVPPPPPPSGGQCYQHGNQYGKGCFCKYSKGYQQDCQSCKDVTQYVKETVWVRTWWGWEKETRWVRKDVLVCIPPVNPGPPVPVTPPKPCLTVNDGYDGMLTTEGTVEVGESLVLISSGVKYTVETTSPLTLSPPLPKYDNGSTLEFSGCTLPPLG
jgi:hypothetical protein